MSLPPKVRCILTPTPLAASLCLAINGSQNAVVNTATQNLTPLVMPKRSTPVTTVQKHVCLHVDKPLVVYMLEDPSSQSAQAHVSRRLVVQNTVTREVIDSLTLADLSYLIYRETDVNKIPQAVQSLGAIQSLDFYDPSTLHWSGMAVGMSDRTRWETVVIQTSSRILLWNLRQGPNSHSVLHPSRKASMFKRLGAIIHETALGGNGAVPSSNLLPLSSTTVLVGCSDGSLKSYDWHQKTVLKSIKGLGKGDWIVKLLPGNRFTANEADSNKRRILTVTKKGICYLIELEIGRDNLEIKPPLARFVGGLAEAPTDSPMQHSTITYDAHRDLICWLSLAPKTKQVSMLVWNLQTLQSDLVQQVGSKNLFKPDPTLTLQLPNHIVEYKQSSGQCLTTVFPVLHSAFAEDTVILGAASLSTGDLHFVGAKFHPTNASSQVIGTSLISTDLAALIQQDGSLDFTPTVRISSLLQTQLSAGSSHSLLVATNFGLVFLELPLSSNPLPAARHVHFGAGLGSLGKSILYVQDSSIMYGSLDVLVGNPCGRMQAKNPVTVYESPAPLHLPAEIQKRPFRSAAVFMPSPSGVFVCLFWPSEFRYEILHTASLLQKVGQRSGQTAVRNPVVANGDGVVDVCWIGDEDVYAILKAPDLVQQATAFMLTAPALEQAEGTNTSVAGLAQSMTKSGITATLAATKSVTSSTLNMTKSATSATLAATKSMSAVTTAATKAAMNQSKKGMKKTLGLFGNKKKKKGDDGGLSMETDTTADDGSENADVSDPMQMAAPLPVDMDINANTQHSNEKRRAIELRSLDLLESKASELSATIPAASSSSMGEVVLRGGNRNIPTAMFGGPVLCVGSRTEEDPEGSAHFYAKKKEAADSGANEYVSTGPTLPYPDMVVWDDDGVLCAVCIENRVAVYGLDSSDFVLLGTVRISHSDTFARVSSAKFVHGVLYCCTYGSVHCVFLGNLDGVCQMESFKIASTDAPTAGPISSMQQYKSFNPEPLPLPLVHPSVLGYQSGSLVISTSRGLHALSLTHPCIRIGCLLSAGQTEAAAKWFDAVPSYECEVLSAFVERRGFPELAINIPGLSLERIIDLCMRFGYVNRLEEAVETYGVRGLRAIDAGRGLSPSLFGEHSGSVVVSVAAYLLANGRVELARRMATECLRSGEEGKNEALLVASLLLSVDEMDATRLIARAVEDAGENWPVAHYIRNYVLGYERT